MKNNPLRKTLNVTRNLVHNISGNLTGGALLTKVFYGNWICGDGCPNNVGRCAMFSDVGETGFYNNYIIRVPLMTMLSTRLLQVLC